MITIKKLKEELEKFNDDDLCFAYEGEVIGLVIENKKDRLGKQGVIYCSEGDDEGKETETID
jgi:hypothetical protein